LHVEIVQPIEITQHESRSESRRSPLARVAVDSHGAALELATREKETAIMFKVVYANLESTGCEFLPEFGWNPVTSFRDKIEGGAESKILFQLHQRAAPAQARFALDIVRKNQRKLFAPGPPWPVFRRMLRSRHNRPYVSDLLA
jgi:hypothetical protein